MKSAQTLEASWRHTDPLQKVRSQNSFKVSKCVNLHCIPVGRCCVEDASGVRETSREHFLTLLCDFQSN